MASNTAELFFKGDDSQLQKTFDNVGSGAKDMASDVGAASRRMASDAGESSGSIAGAVDASEGKFRGLGDVIGGTGDIMEGFKTGNVAQMAMGMADMAGGISSLVIPALTFLKTTILTSVVPAMWAVVSHPLFIAIAVGGAIIGALFLLEKKFGVVTTAIGWVKDALSGVWDWVKNNWDDLANILTAPFLGAFRLISKAWNATMGGFGFTIPSWVPGLGGNSFKFPSMPSFSFHQGGVVPGAPGSEVLATLQAGEEVLTAAQRASSGRPINIYVQGSVIAERDLGRTVADALRNYGLIGGMA